jgi:glycosyltransferase involved in cell wall biosynthesis
MSEARKTLVIITPAFPANESETYWVPSQQSLAKAIKKKFPDLHITVLAYYYPYFRGEYSWHQIHVASFNGQDLGAVKKLLLFRNIWNRLKKIKKEEKLIGILSFWCREGALVSKWFAKRHNLKHFCWVCGQDARRTNQYAKWASLKSEELIAISDFIAEEYFRNHKIKPATVIPNGIDTDLFPADLNQQRDIDLLAVGSLIPLKQFDIFISVVKQLKERLPEIKAIICGDGGEKERLNSLIEKFNLKNNMTIVDAMMREEVLKLMGRTKILIHPSSFEGFSTVCLEALYAGANVISFVKPMHQEIKNWHIVKTNEEMVAKASDLLHSTNLSHEKVMVYSIEDNAGKFMRLFSLNIKK